MTRRRNQTRRGASSGGIDSTRPDARCRAQGFTLLGYVASLVALFYLISFVAFAVAS